MMIMLTKMLFACFLIKHFFLTKIYSNKFPKISAIDILPFVSMMDYFVYVILSILAYLYGTPAMRKFKLLPECNKNIPPKADTYIHTIGFGSDKFLNDYKVIYVRDYVDLETDIPGPTHYAVYRMSTNSRRVLMSKNVKHFFGMFFYCALLDQPTITRAIESYFDGIHSNA